MCITPQLHVIAAVSAADNGIGMLGKLPWRLPSDMAYFQKLTLYLNRSSPSTPGTLKPFSEDVESSEQSDLNTNVVIMGRKTWDSIPSKFRPLKGRRNIILTRDPHFKTQVAKMSHHSSEALVCNSLQEALDLVCKDSALNHHGIWIMGGGALYQEAVQNLYCKHVFLTVVEKMDGSSIECDVFFPFVQQNPHYQLASKDQMIEYLGEHAPVESIHENGYNLQFQLYNRIT